MATCRTCGTIDAANILGVGQIRPRARRFRKPTHVRIITRTGMCAIQYHRLCLAMQDEGVGDGTTALTRRSDHAPDVSAIPRMLEQLHG